MNLTEKILKNGVEFLTLDEYFMQIPNWKMYFCSNYGRLAREEKDGHYHIVKPSIDSDGYLRYTLSKPARRYKGKIVRDKNGKAKRNYMSTTANRLVAKLFVKYNPYENRYDYSMENLDTHHKDHNRHNNYFKNLMWLANGKDGTRADHQFVNTIKKIALYNGNSGKYHTFKDIERLCIRIDTDILELIDILKDKDTIKIKDGKWTTYKVNDYYVGIQFFARKDRKRGK